MGPNRKKQGFLSSKYYLDDFKSSCKDYTQKLTRLNYLTFTDGLTRELTVYLKHKSLAVLSDEMAQCCTIKVIVGWIKQGSTGTAQS